MKTLKELFRNKKLEDLNEKIESLKEKIELLEFEVKNPQPYKIGDKISKNEIVCNVTLKRISKYNICFGYKEFIEWEVEVTNTKTGKKTII